MLLLTCMRDRFFLQELRPWIKSIISTLFSNLCWADQDYYQHYQVSHSSCWTFQFANCCRCLSSLDSGKYKETQLLYLMVKKEMNRSLMRFFILSYCNLRQQRYFISILRKQWGTQWCWLGPRPNLENSKTITTGSWSEVALPHSCCLCLANL